MDDHGVNVLPWPANSSDMYTIKNFWGVVKKCLQLHRCNNLWNLNSAILSVWNVVMPADCVRPVKSKLR